MPNAFPPLIVRCESFYDGTSAAPRRDATVVVVDGAIASVAFDGDRPEAAPGGARELHAAAVIPGLINAHVHLEMSGEPQTTSVFVLTTATQRTLVSAENARKALHAGVTTVRDLGSSESVAIDVRDAIAAGRIEGPTVFSAGNAICMSGGHGWWIGRQADGPWDVRKAVREQLRRGADCIKFIASGGVLTKGAVPGIAQLTRDEMAAGVEEAHAHGLRVAAHAIGVSGIRNALQAGVDSIEHGLLVDDETIELLLASNAFLVPTLAAIDCIVNGPAWRRARATRRPTGMGTPQSCRDRRAGVGAAHPGGARGVRIAAGADSGTPFNYHDQYWHELVLMRDRLGMSVREVLRAATSSAALLLGTRAGNSHAASRPTSCCSRWIPRPTSSAHARPGSGRQSRPVVAEASRP